MSDLMTALRLVLSGDPAGAVAAIEQVAVAQDKLTASAAKQDAAWTATAKSGHAGMMLMGAGAALTTGLILGTVDAYGKQAEAIIMVQKQTGASATWSSDFVAQAQAMGIASDNVSTFLGRMAKNVTSYTEGTAKGSSVIAQSFKDLGLSADQLKGKDAGSTIDMIREKLAKMPAGFERDYVMQSLFGRGAAGNPDLMRFLTAAQSQLDTINKQAKSFGLVFSQSQLDNAKQYGEEMRMLKLEFEGIAVQLGRSFAPVLADIGKTLAVVLAGFNHLPGPLKDFLALLPGVLLMAVGFMKVYTAVSTLVKGGLTLIEALRGIVAGQVKNMIATDEATTATEGETIATEAETGALKSGIIELGLYAIAIGAAVLAIYEIVKAYDAWKNAAQQASQAYSQYQSNANADLQKIGQKYGTNSSQYRQEQQIVSQDNQQAAGDKYSSPSVAGWVGGALGGYASKQVQPWKWFAQGGDFTANGPTVIGVGEAGSEHVSITPAGQGGAGGISIVVQMAGANLYGVPDQATFNKWGNGIAQALGNQLHAALNGSRG